MILFKFGFVTDLNLSIRLQQKRGEQNSMQKLDNQSKNVAKITLKIDVSFVTFALTIL